MLPALQLLRKYWGRTLVAAILLVVAASAYGAESIVNYQLCSADSRYWSTCPPDLTTGNSSDVAGISATVNMPTDTAGGTLYCLTNTTASVTDLSAIRAGSSQAVSASGSQVVSVTGLTEDTTYYTHCYHEFQGRPRHPMPGSDYVETVSYTTASTAGSWASRSTAAGVVWASGFDSLTDITDYCNIEPPADIGQAAVNTQPGHPQKYPNNKDPRNIGGYGADTLWYPSVEDDVGLNGTGDGALRMQWNNIPEQAHSGALVCGNNDGGPAWSTTFLQGDTLYVQFRMKLTPNWAQVDENVIIADTDASGSKWIILHGRKSCGQTEWTLQHSDGRGFLQAYTNCGGGVASDWFEVGSGNEQAAPWNTDYPAKSGARSSFSPQDNIVYQAGPLADDPFCLRSNFFDITNQPGTVDETTGYGCLMLDDFSETWMTIYIKLEIGGDGTADSKYQMWVDRADGDGFRQIIDMNPAGNVPWDYDNGGNEGEIRNLTLTNYNTNKSTTVAGEANTITWYDEVIVSSQPINRPSDVPSGPHSGSADCGIGC